MGTALCGPAVEWKKRLWRSDFSPGAECGWPGEPGATEVLFAGACVGWGGSGCGGGAVALERIALSLW